MAQHELKKANLTPDQLAAMGRRKGEQVFEVIRPVERQQQKSLVSLDQIERRISQLREAKTRNTDMFDRQIAQMEQLREQLTAAGAVKAPEPAPTPKPSKEDQEKVVAEIAAAKEKAGKGNS